MAEDFDLIVIGGGPGGYVAAIRAAQLGKRVICVEKRKALGGTCLNVGCIPSKALLDSSELYEITGHRLARHGIGVQNVSLDLAAMMSRKDKVVTQLTDGVAFLFKKNKVTRLHGTAKLTKDKSVEVALEDGTTQTLTAPAILLAAGSEVTAIPSLPLDGERIVSSTEALAFSEVPKKLLIVGAGYIGLELGSVWCRLGSEVTVLEFLPHVLPLTDREIAGMVQKGLEKQGLKFRLTTKVNSAKREGDIVKVSATGPNGEETFDADRVLVAVGRRPAVVGVRAWKPPASPSTPSRARSASMTISRPM